jgi:PhoH-like ATPase
MSHVSPVVEVADEFFDDFTVTMKIDDVYQYLDDSYQVFLDTLPENFYFTAKSMTGDSRAIKYRKGFIHSIDPVTHSNITPANVEQIYLSDALAATKDTSLLCVTGKAGTGKTLMVMAYAIEMIMKTKKDIILTKSRVQVTDDDEEPMGEVPGSYFEKMSPQLLSYQSVLNKVVGKGRSADVYFEELVKTKRIQVVPLEFMRGIDFSNSIVICDEAQNLGRSQLKTLGTRINKNSRLILMADTRQHDRFLHDEIPFNTLINSPLFLDSPICSHVHLTRQERGPLADLFDNIF